MGHNALLYSAVLARDLAYDNGSQWMLADCCGMLSPNKEGYVPILIQDKHLHNDNSGVGASLRGPWLRC